MRRIGTSHRVDLCAIFFASVVFFSGAASGEESEASIASIFGFGSKQAALELLVGGKQPDPADFELSEVFLNGFSTVPGNMVVNKIFPRSEPDPGGFAYSFIHFSDIQVRDRRWRECKNSAAKLCFDPFDDRVESVHNDFYQDSADVFYLGYVLKAIRMSALSGRAQFVFHTGDSVHGSRTEELKVFTDMTTQFLLTGESTGEWDDDAGWLTAAIRDGNVNKSRFFNVFGNHDLFYFGNVRSPSLYMNTPPISLGAGNQKGQYFRNYARLQRQLGLVAIIYTPSKRVLLNHGGVKDGRFEVHPQPMAAAGWYYCDMEIPGATGKKVRIMAINGNETAGQPAGALYPAISPKQLDWIKETLDDAQARDEIDHVLVFGHQPLELIRVNKPGGMVRDRDPRGVLVKMFAEHPKVIAYFRGDIHGGKVEKHNVGTHQAQADDNEVFGVMEYGAPSIIESPKTFTYVTIKSQGRQRWQIKGVFHNLDDLIEAGAIEPDALIDSGLVIRNEAPLSYVPTYLNQGPTEKSLKSWVKYLDGLGLPTDERMLLLALFCQEGAKQDARAQYDRGYVGYEIFNEQEWRGQRLPKKVEFESSFTIIK